jgi:preprotein translocase subunit SecF
MRFVTYKFDFVHRRKTYFLIFLVTSFICIASLFLQGLNLGIDFVSGTRLDIEMEKQVEIEKAREILERLGYQKPNTRLGGAEQRTVIFRTDQVIDRHKIAEIKAAFDQAFQTKSSIQEQKVEPIVGREIARNAIISVLIASIGIIIYITLRFEYRFAVSAVVSLLYNALFIIGLFSLFQLEVDIVFIAAVLTIIGYAVNDTIVIFDRIRENLKLAPPKSWEQLAHLVNESIHQTLVRSLNTVLTVIFAAAALYLFGGGSIRTFSFDLLIGLISGDSSSIFLASQIWVGWKWKSMQKERGMHG